MVNRGVIGLHIRLKDKEMRAAVGQHGSEGSFQSPMAFEVGTVWRDWQHGVQHQGQGFHHQGITSGPEIHLFPIAQCGPAKQPELIGAAPQLLLQLSLLTCPVPTQVPHIRRINAWPPSFRGRGSISFASMACSRPTRPCGLRSCPVRPPRRPTPPMKTARPSRLHHGPG